MSEERCANCGYPRREHSYNGACYGLCGEFVPPQPEPNWKARATQAEAERDAIEQKWRAAAGALASVFNAVTGFDPAGMDDYEDAARQIVAALSASQARESSMRKAMTRVDAMIAVNAMRQPIRDEIRAALSASPAQGGDSATGQTAEGKNG